MGYHHLDGAEMYNTEEELGKAIKACGVSREKLFITTKCSKTTSNIEEHFNESLKKLGLDYVDLYLLHSPFEWEGNKKILQSAWAVMVSDCIGHADVDDADVTQEKIAASGKARSIGVSNFYREHLEAILETCEARPAINQIEFHTYLQHSDLVQFHKSKDIKIAAYGPLVPLTKVQNGPVTPIIEKLAHKYAVNPGEILLRWVMEQGVVAITTSSKEQRMSDMLRTVTFNLNPREVEEITEAGKSHHFRAFWTHILSEDDKS